MKPTVDVASGTSVLDRRLVSLDDATRDLARTPDFGKTTKIRRVLEQLRRVLLQEGGPAAVQARARQLEEAGVFAGTDWAQPDILVPAFVGAGCTAASPTRW